MGLCADSTTKVVAGNAGGACSINLRESCTGNGNIDTYSAVEELSAVADNTLDTCAVDHCVTFGAVEARSVVGIVPIARYTDCIASISLHVVPESVLAGKYAVVGTAISVDGDQVSRKTKLAESTWLIDAAEGNLLDASTLIINLNLITSIAI